MSLAIKIENLSKQYRLGLVSTRTLSHDLNRWWQTSVRGKEDPYLKIGETNDKTTNGDSEYVWALKDINLEVQEGEVLGIIGKNGAGKSTLLKILSKVTAPTTGIVKARGRIASLLEVGTGFHPEMTGRENIYMNGSIMGMTKSEITLKLDEIIDFSGVERYIDTPVKRYSSGMYVRLAFAVAAHLECEIMIVDEVLAVGDAEFQKKCLGKMGEVSKGEGRTVLFVSHNMQAIRQLCDRIILLNAGEIMPVTGKEDAIKQYYPAIMYPLNNSFKFPVEKEVLIVNDFSVRQNNTDPFEYLGDVPISITINYELIQDTRDFRIGFYIKSSIGDFVARTFLSDWHMEYASQKKGFYKLRATIPAKLLPQGSYTIELKAGIQGIIDYGIEAELSHSIAILNPLDYNNAYPNERFEGAVLLNPNWTVDKL